MIVQYHPDFINKLKSANIRIRKKFHEKIELFLINPNHASLHNHPVKKEYAGFRSINITNDYRALYEETSTEKEIIAYFVLLGTHKELYE